MTYISEYFYSNCLIEAIKAKIVELTAELEVADETTGGVEETVTSL